MAEPQRRLEQTKNEVLVTVAAIQNMHIIYVEIRIALALERQTMGRGSSTIMSSKMMVIPCTINIFLMIFAIFKVTLWLHFDFSAVKSK